MRRRLLLTPLQMWGLPLIALLPVLALFGVVGIAHDEVSAEGDGLRLEVRYPRRSHSGVTVPLTITVSNQGQAPLEDVYLVLPRDYLESFEEFELRPSADSVSQDAYRIVLGSLPAGASRVATALLTP